MAGFSIKMSALAVTAGLASAAFFGSVQPSAAVVYCKTVGYPKGCVVRPNAVVVRPPVRVVYCTRPGYPRGCIIR